jgi:DNA-directed RNA polymerase specialized sigma subunit
MEDYLRTLGEIALRRPHEFTTDHREEEDRDIWETIGRYDDGLQYVIRWPHDVRSALHREFYELSSRDRDLLCLIYADELPITWAGRELGLSDGYAVERHRVLILRLRARLREFVV